MSDRGSSASLEAFASRWIVAGFALAGLIIGLAVFSVREPVYEARAIVSVNNPLGTMGDEAALVTSDRVLSPATAALGFVPDIEVEPNEIADLLNITARAGDPTDAADAANLVAQFYEQSQTTTAVRIADVAEPDPAPVAPSRMAHVLLGSLLGALAGFAVSSARTLRAALPTRVRADEAERPEPIRPAMAPSAGLSTLASPDDAGPSDDRFDDGVDAADFGEPGFADGTSSDGPTLDLRGEYAIVSPAGTPEGSGSGHQISDDVRIIGTAPATSAAPSNAFSSAASSMVARPPVPSSSWRSGDGEPAARRTPPRRAQAARSEQPVVRRVEQQAQPVTAIPAPAAQPAPAAFDAQAPTNPAPTNPAPTKPAPTDPAPATPAPATPAHTSVSEAELFEADATRTELSQTEVPEPSMSEAHDLSDVTRANLDADREVEDLRTAYEARINDLILEHTETLGNVEADFERQQGDLKRELADARKEARIAAAQIKRLSGDDQHRIGDLEAQAEALEAEISTLRGQLESERIAHLRELTSERDAADRALDNARREFRDQLDEIETQNRRSLADNRAELDELLAAGRAEHQAALDRQHSEYDQALTRERERHKADLARLAERHREEMTKARAQAEQETERQIRLTKQTISDLRSTEKRLSTELEDLRQAERQYRAELTNVRKQSRYGQQKSNETEQALRDELALAKKSLTAEKERNAALRDDVVRRTAEAHQAVDRAIEDRSAQLAELESLVAKHRQHAEERVREATASAEERARESARREAELSARITRLERELDEVRRQTG